MSALRRTLVWIFLASAAVAGAGLSLGFAVQASRVVLVPDSLGPLVWPVCVPVAPDSVGSVIRWWPARLAQ